MSDKLLLDTNAVAAFLAGEPSVVARCQAAPQLYVPAVVVGELWHGALKSGRPQYNLERLREFVSSVTVLSLDLLIAQCYGQIKHNLHKKGRPIPDNDTWIAAVAMQHGCAILTRDKHFTYIDAVTVEACEVRRRCNRGNP